MLELLGYLRANGFKTYIVSGGGVDFMRAFAERVYGIPPEQVIGSTGELKFEMRNGVPTMNKLAALDYFDDKDAKPVAIQRHIGRRPIAAFGNSDGDLQMLQWTCAGPGARYCLFVRHTDAEREFAYDKSPMGGPGCWIERRRREGLDGRRHEERLEDHLPVPEEVARNGIGRYRHMTRISVMTAVAIMAVALLLPTPSAAQLNGSHTPGDYGVQSGSAALARVLCRALLSALRRRHHQRCGRQDRPPSRRIRQAASRVPAVAPLAADW